MEPEVRQPANRLRLIDVRPGADAATVQFGKRLAAVLTEPGRGRDVARLIAAIVVGPRPEGADGSVEVDGEVVSVRTRPSPLLPPGSASFVDRSTLAAIWQSCCARRRDALAAEEASRRSEQHRIDAALEHLDTPPPAPDAVPEPPAGDAADDEQAGLRAQIRALLDAHDQELPAPLPEGQLLADAWVAHAALVRACEAAPVEQLETLERRVDAARAALADLRDPVPEEVRARIELAHQDVLESEAHLLETKRWQRPRTVARYEQAVAVELGALADAGMGSYAVFLAAVEAGDQAAAGARAEAEAELAVARAELDDARLVRDVPTRLELAEREALMRERATELLGHEPGPDAPAELRTLRVQPERTSQSVEEIATLLHGAGAPVGPDVIASARAFLACARPAPAPPEPVAPEPAPGPAHDDRLALEEQRRALDAATAEAAAEFARLDAAAGVSVEQMSADELVAAFDQLFAEYRAGALLAGTLPMVVDGVLDGITRDARQAATARLAAAEDIQIILVSDDPEVLQGLANAGAALVRWPQP